MKICFVTKGKKGINLWVYLVQKKKYTLKTIIVQFNQLVAELEVTTSFGNWFQASRALIKKR